MKFIQKYNPEKLEDFILPDRITSKFKNGIDKSQLFYGTSGIGKSSMAKFLSKNSSYPYLYHNSSRNSSVDELREGGSIYEFCSETQISLDGKTGKKKIVILDEVNGVSIQFFEALKGFMDTYSEKVIFIATTNHINLVPAPILSRFGGGICFDSENDTEKKEVFVKYVKRIAYVLKNEGISYDKDSIVKFAKKMFPDLRMTLERIEELKFSGGSNIEESNTQQIEELSELYNLIVEGNGQKPEYIHSILKTKYNTQVDSVMQSLELPFISWIEKNHPGLSVVIPNISIKVSYYTSIKHTGIDPSLHLRALIWELINIFAQVKGKI